MFFSLFSVFALVGFRGGQEGREGGRLCLQGAIGEGEKAHGGEKKEDMLIGEVKLTDFGVAKPAGLSKEDERSAALAARAQKGDYDDGMLNQHFYGGAFD